MRGGLLELARGVALSLALAPAAALAQPAPPAQPPSPLPPPPEGFHVEPTVFWQGDGQRVDLSIASRVRTEDWSAFSNEGFSWYTGTRTRVRLGYSWRDEILAVGEFQDVRLHGMDDDGTGALATYRNANEGRSRVSGDDLRVMFLELRPFEKTFVRAGRQEIKLDSQEVQYAEPNWRYLRSARLGERLVGTVDWSHVGRTFDGLSAGGDAAGVRLFGFGARPTQGVYEVEAAYRPLHDVFVGGATATVPRGAWLANDELGLFATYYDDQRSPAHGGLADGVSITTIGAHWLGVHPCGPGNVDVLLWGAYQTGQYDDLDHLAGAGILELGYQLPEVIAKPWIRVGLNVATGDGNPNDGDHHTFFNMLPTNHIYYGFADQLAFQNLWDSFVQLRLAPHPMLALNLFVHQLRLLDASDSRYAGTGAYDLTSFGFPATTSNGHRNVGTEYDVVATFSPHKAVTIEAGFEWLDGGAVFQNQLDRDAQLGYVALELEY